MIKYTDSLKRITTKNLDGFFVGWLHRPSNKIFLRLLKNSDHVILALDGSRVVGFITAISDGVLSAYIPFLEVLPEYQKRGVGKALAKRMLSKLNKLYMIDLLCDENIQPFYKKLGMKKANGMMIRNYNKQSGK